MYETVEQHPVQQRFTRASGAQKLRAVGSGETAGLVVIANREPYAHEYRADGSVEVTRPASGLVSGIEPMLKACGGTWIATATGSADRQAADGHGRLHVPADSRDYVLRRLWFEHDLYERYYSGFANEGLWPLCHTAHARPSFRPADWAAYERVNEQFARAALDEIGGSSLVLVQDYHFALVPRMIRNLAPRAMTNIFWHIPWPNAEIFGICPWKEQLLEGILGADVAGFHTRQYSLNFLDAAQRYLECRVDREEMSISFRGRKTLVRDYPISVEWPYPAAPASDGRALRESLAIAADVHVSVGVDRADYTKGLVERIAAIELLLEEHPELHGRYVHVQLASPTRTHIREYQRLADDVRDAVRRVNGRFGSERWMPLQLHMRTFAPEEVRRHYAMADSALVTPLHDGMNLVAKEYVAARADGDGVLVLSEFAGAAKELEAALLVNPYDARQTAEAILRAIHMPAPERRARMQLMRDQIAGHSIYDWGASLLDELRAIRKQKESFFATAPASRLRLTAVPATRVEALSR